MRETLLELLLYEADTISSDESAGNRAAEVAHLHALIMQILEDPKVHNLIALFD